MNKMGIRIDLSAFFQDERKMVYVMVDQNWESVENLQKRVEYLFDIDSVRFLNSDGYYLPSQESIEIVRFCEGLKAIITNDSLNKSKKKKSKKSKGLQISPREFEIGENLVNIEDAQQDDDVQKKRKYYSMDSVHSAETDSNNAKRLKCSRANNKKLSPVRFESKCMEITSTSEQMQSPSSKKKKTKHLKDCGDIHESQSSHIMKNKRKLIMGKETDNEEEKIFNCAKSSALSTGIPSSTFINESNMIAQKHSKRNALHSSNLDNPFKEESSKAHIHFNESGEIVSTTNKSQSKSDKQSKAIVVFRCSLQEVTNEEEIQKPRVFCVQRKGSYNKKEKQLIEIKENIVLPPISNLAFENKSLLLKEKAEIDIEQARSKISEIDTEAELLSEKTDLNDTTKMIESTTIVKDTDITLDNCTEKSQIENNTEVTLSEKNSTLKSPSGKSGTISVDYVDLSIELEENDIPKANLETCKEKHHVTNDKNGNDSSSDIEEISEIIDLNETEDNCNSTFNDSPACSRSLKDIKVDQILPFCSKMTEMPNFNDIIVFKMAYVNKKQKLEETNFLAGKVEYINKRTKSIKVLILDGFTEMSYIDSKFLFNLEDSQDFVKYIQVKMNDLIEPKIFSKR